MTDEIPAVRELAQQLDLRGRIVTLAALHGQQETEKTLCVDCQANSLVTAANANQPTLLAVLQHMEFAAEPDCPRPGNGHGRIERRRD